MTYTDAMFRMETKLAEARAAGDSTEADFLGKELEALGSTHCVVCGTMIRFNHLDGWVHEDAGMDHTGRPDRYGFEWPSELNPPGATN